MDSIDKWLKSLRLHKYTHLFKSLTYEQMLNLEEQYLIDLDITKGARNKILVSVKKLNLRQERLINMIDDINQDNISMKEALTVLKDMLITPIPPPSSDSQANLNHPVPYYSTSTTLPGTITTLTTMTTTPAAITNNTTITQQPAAPIASAAPNSLANNLSALVNNHYYSDPNHLTHLFVDTFEKVAHRLIESAGMEDNACHGIMAAIVDECLKHNSFTKGQKARVASFKQHFMKEQKARMASYKQQSRNNLLQQHQLQQRVVYGCAYQYNSALSQNHSYHHQSHQFHHNNQHYLHHNSNQHYHYNHTNGGSNNSSSSSSNSSSSNNNISSSINKSSFNSSDSSDSINNHYHHQHNNHWNHASGPIHHQPSPPSLSASLSTIGSASTSTSDEEEQRQRTYKEYSLLGPGMTFELPCLRAIAAAEKHNRRQLGFFS